MSEANFAKFDFASHRISQSSFYLSLDHEERRRNVDVRYRREERIDLRKLREGKCTRRVKEGGIAAGERVYTLNEDDNNGS